MTQPIINDLKSNLELDREALESLAGGKHGGFKHKGYRHHYRRRHYGYKHAYKYFYKENYNYAYAYPKFDYYYPTYYGGYGC